MYDPGLQARAIRRGAKLTGTIDEIPTTNETETQMKKRNPHLLLATIELQFVTDRFGHPDVRTSSQIDDDLTIRERCMIISALDNMTIALRHDAIMRTPLRKLYFGCSREDETEIFATVIDSGDLPRAGKIFDALRPDILQKAGMKEIDEDVVIPDDCMNVAFREAELYARVPQLALI
jgi:hypothetical protein